MDEAWSTVWFWEKAYMLIFIAFTAAVMVVLRPTESLKSLSQIDELLDETLQEQEESPFNQEDQNVNQQYI